MVSPDRGKRKRVGYEEFPEDGEADQDDGDAMQVCLGGSNLATGTGKFQVEHQLCQPCMLASNFSARLEFDLVHLSAVVKDMSRVSFLVI